MLSELLFCMMIETKDHDEKFVRLMYENINACCLLLHLAFYANKHKIFRLKNEAVFVRESFGLEMR